jgi:hypothetical protein
MTRKLRSFRPSPALVVSCVALFLTLTGTALALGRNTVRSSQIVDGSIRTVDLQDAAIDASKLAPNSIGSSKLQDGAVRASQLGPIVQVENGTFLNPGENGTVHVECPETDVLLGGGGLGDNYLDSLMGSAPSLNGWRIYVHNGSNAGSRVIVYARCLIGGGSDE